MPTPAENQLGLISCLAFVVGNIVGSGIFITPSIILTYTGSLGLSLLVWLGCGLFTLIGGLVFIELGTAIPADGGDFSYTKAVKWNNLAFSLMFIGAFVSYPGSGAIQANTFSKYFVFGLESIFDFGPWRLVVDKCLAAGLIIICTVVNYLPVGKGVSIFQIAAVNAKILVLFTIVGYGMFHLLFLNEHQNVNDPFKGTNLSPGAIAMACYQALWAFAGWDILNAGTPSVKDPKKTFPFAILGGITTVIVIFIFINISFCVILGVEGMKKSDAIAADFAKACMGPLYHAVPFATALMLVSTVNGSIFAVSRIMSKAAEERQVPKLLAVHHKSFKTPVAALIVQMILCLILLWLPIETIIAYASVIMWLQKSVSVAALLKIRYKKMTVDDGVIKVPLPFIITFFVISVSLTTFPIFTETGMAAIGFGAVFILASLFHLLNRFAKPEWFTKLDEAAANFACWLLNGEIIEHSLETTTIVAAMEEPETEHLV